MAQGTVKRISDEKGYDFITPDEGGIDPPRRAARMASESTHAAWEARLHVVVVLVALLWVDRKRRRSVEDQEAPRKANE